MTREIGLVAKGGFLTGRLMMPIDLVFPRGISTIWPGVSEVSEE